MTKHKRDNVPALVLAVVTRVYEVAQGWTQPWYVDRTRLSLSDAPEGVGKMHDAERDPGHYIDLTEHGDVMGVLPLSKLPVTREEYDTLLRAKAGSMMRDVWSTERSNSLRVGNG